MNFVARENLISTASGLDAVETRVLVLTHSHPRLTRGGAEIAADALVRGLREDFGVRSFLLGCSFTPLTERLGLNLTQPFGEDDFVYQASSAFDHLKFANRDVKFPKMFADLLDEIRPQVLHFHHYTQFGVEAFAIAKRVNPALKIVLTLHEFLAICHNYGQMVKAKSLQLCEESGLVACSRCFPTLAPRDFFLRKSYIQTFFKHVDLFISPSRFLAQRYIDWGLPKDRTVVLENVPPTPPPSSRTSPPGTPATRIRVGFFGQLSPTKGVQVLLDAARELASRGVINLVLDIHGDYSNQPPEFQNSVIAALAETSANVRFHGPYDNAKVHRLMRSVDAVVIPSIWWENAPVVIEEALANGRPLICSDIGGMAEAVRHGWDGLHFSAGDSFSLADTLAELAKNPGRLDELRETLRKPRPARDVVGDHLALYRRLLAPAAESETERRDREGVALAVDEAREGAS